eukprot:6190854-Pleurochrysis_carterae.AAC.2
MSIHPCLTLAHSCTPTPRCPFSLLPSHMREVSLLARLHPRFFASAATCDQRRVPRACPQPQAVSPSGGRSVPTGVPPTAGVVRLFSRLLEPRALDDARVQRAAPHLRGALEIGDHLATTLSAVSPSPPPDPSSRTLLPLSPSLP